MTVSQTDLQHNKYSLIASPSDDTMNTGHTIQLYPHKLWQVMKQRGL